MSASGLIANTLSFNLPPQQPTIANWSSKLLSLLITFVKNPVIYSRALCKPVHDRRWNAVEVRQHLGPPTHRFCTHQQQKNSNWGKTDKPGIQSEMIVETFDFVVSVAETILFNINFKNRKRKCFLIRFF